MTTEPTKDTRIRSKIAAVREMTANVPAMLQALDEIADGLAAEIPDGASAPDQIRSQVQSVRKELIKMVVFFDPNMINAFL